MLVSIVASAKMNCESRFNILGETKLAKGQGQNRMSTHVIKARCAFRRKAASCAKDVKVVFGLQKPLTSVGGVSGLDVSWTAEIVVVDRSGEDVESSPKGRHDAFNAAGFAGWKYR
jgi:hypothetical protein